MITLSEFLAESNLIEGYSIVKDKEMEGAKCFLNLKEITAVDICNFVSTTTRAHNSIGEIRSIHGLNVIVGEHIPPPGGPQIVERLKIFAEDINAVLEDDRYVSAFNLHLYYETLHPFTGGNGRSGRLIWLYCMGGNDWLKASSYNFLQTFYYQSLQNSKRII